MLLEQAPRYPRVHRESEASPQVFHALGLVVNRRLARTDGLKEKPRKCCVQSERRGGGGREVAEHGVVIVLDSSLH